MEQEKLVGSRYVPARLRRALRALADRPFNRERVSVDELGLPGCSWWCLPAALGHHPTVLSGGVGRDLSFELCIAEKHGARVAMFDPSPTGAQTVAELGALPDRVRYFEFGLSSRTGVLSFAPPASPEEGSFRHPQGVGADLQFRCLDPVDALRMAGFGAVSMLKLDVEGFEYEFLERMLAQGIRPSQIAVEFHHFLNGFGYRATISSIMGLCSAGYTPVRKRSTDWLFVRSDCLR